MHRYIHHLCVFHIVVLHGAEVEVARDIEKNLNSGIEAGLPYHTPHGRELCCFHLLSNPPATPEEMWSTSTKNQGKQLRAVVHKQNEIRLHRGTNLVLCFLMRLTVSRSTEEKDHMKVIVI